MVIFVRALHSNFCMGKNVWQFLYGYFCVRVIHSNFCMVKILVIFCVDYIIFFVCVEKH